ncbi:hypothetical protein [Streptococcus sp. S784/96/1]|uniref:hypothetical protein n=1 Tax=Streptococcus sp. S784/96/1 TaxID=2653499 RepID=UPI00138A5B7C|nr:hypothetical protein [Streptococcus sp. S784/96/1]
MKKVLFQMSKEKYSDSKLLSKISIILIGIFCILLLLDVCNIPTYLNMPTDYNWLALLGSFIGSWVTIYGIVKTLEFERGIHEAQSKNEVRPVLNVSGDISKFEYNDSKPDYSYFVYEETHYSLLKDSKIPSFKLTVNNRIGFYHEFEMIDKGENKTIYFNTGPKIFVKIRNIGLGHAIINKFIFNSGSGESYVYHLGADEKFSIDSNTSNIILFNLPLSKPKTIQIYFQDILKTDYCYTMKLEYMDELNFNGESHPNLVLVKQYNLDKPITNFKIASNVYFEDYFPIEIF